MDQERIGKFIKEIRKKNNLTQKELADRYNVTYQAVSKWENGKNLPDKSLIKQMSKDFNISIDDLFEGEYSKKNLKKKNIYIISLTIIFITIIIGIVLLIINKNDNDSFEFKTLSANCSNFNISGSIAYNDSKSSIYISNVSYCGGDDNTEYTSIKCTLYEKNNDSSKVIDNYNYDKNNKITLEDFLKEVSFTIDNYQKVCKSYTKDSLYLEIEATDESNQITTYKIPLTLEDKCQQ